jgi:hypothetical protein
MPANWTRQMLLNHAEKPRSTSESSWWRVSSQLRSSPGVARSFVQPSGGFSDCRRGSNGDQLFKAWEDHRGSNRGCGWIHSGTADSADGSRQNLDSTPERALSAWQPWRLRPRYCNVSTSKDMSTLAVCWYRDRTCSGLQKCV